MVSAAVRLDILEKVVTVSCQYRGVHMLARMDKAAVVRVQDILDLNMQDVAAAA